MRDEPFYAMPARRLPDLPTLQEYMAVGVGKARHIKESAFKAAVVQQAMGQYQERRWTAVRIHPKPKRRRYWKCWEV
jgi:hypothetical protein